MREIVLTNNQIALVDEDDFMFLDQRNWYCRKTSPDKYYAVTVINKKQIYMHRFIMNPPSHLDVDHKDGNSLNNCRNNLRICSPSSNCANAKAHRNKEVIFKGVSKVKSSGSFCAEIFVKGRKISLGSFSMPERAAKAYDSAAIKYFGEFAKTNRMLGILT